MQIYTFHVLWDWIIILKNLLSLSLFKSLRYSWISSCTEMALINESAQYNYWLQFFKNKLKDVCFCCVFMLTVHPIFKKTVFKSISLTPELTLFFLINWMEYEGSTNFNRRLHHSGICLYNRVGGRWVMVFILYTHIGTAIPIQR